MNKNFKSGLVLLGLIFLGLVAQAQTPDQKLASLFQDNRKEVLVAAHRGDWRQTPENSLKSLLNSIENGYDIMELDVKMSKDSQLVVMHDNTIDRTTNGKGKPGDFTLAELKTLRLRNGLGRVTNHTIPTLSEMMQAAKGKIIINVDKGNKWLPQVFEVLKNTGTLAQTIVNVDGNIPLQKLQQGTAIPEKAFVMVVVAMKRPDAILLIESYKGHQHSVIQPIFDTDTLASIRQLPRIAKKQVIWLNSLWPSLNGGHDDDRAVEENQPEESWGWLLDHQPAIIQTDRPAELLKYLQVKGRHQ